MDRLAYDVFRHHLLINGVEYEFTEIEMYLHSTDHPDQYTHCHSEQQNYATWYFHRQGNSYRGGTFKGMDLVLGSGTTYFGILIRSIYSPQTGMISGPCLVVNHILQAYKVESISELVNGFQLSATNNHHGLVIRPGDIQIGQVYSGPRYGLKPETYSEFALRPYRFVRRYEEGKKLKAKLTLTKI